jgi:3-methyladenine DNA glycosylase AlkD
MNKSIKKQLLALADPGYQKFSSSLLPNVEANSIIGVRLPQLRKISKQLAKADWKSYLKTASDDTFEEIMLQGMVIGSIKADIDEVLPHVADFIKKINNWSVCDSFCSGLKLPLTYPEKMWDFLQSYLKDTREYHLRFGVVMLLNYYIDEQHIEEVLSLLDSIRHDGYYVKMAVAWAISVCYVKLPERTMEYLKNNALDDFTYNKALQKITESRRVDQKTKLLIRSLKR